MPRNLKPHGTVAAARRHQRAEEPLCDPCADAWREYRERLRERPAAAATPPSASASATDLPDEAAEVAANLAAVIAAMETAPASAIAPLSRRREELDLRLRRLREDARQSRALSESAETRETFAAMLQASGIEL